VPGGGKGKITKGEGDPTRVGCSEVTSSLSSAIMLS
jgi:hypothetical protein